MGIKHYNQNAASGQIDGSSPSRVATSFIVEYRMFNTGNARNVEEE